MGVRERRAGFGDAVDGRGELGHDLGLLRIAEVEAVGGGHGGCAGGGHFARGFGHGVHGAELGIEIAQRPLPSRAMARPRSWPGVPVPLMRMTPASPPGPMTVLVCTMVSYCSWTQRLEQTLALASSFFRSAVKSRSSASLASDFGGRFERDGRLPRADGAVVERRVVGERLVGNVGHQHAVVADAQARLGLRPCPR